jgi:hypothetical protein
MNSTVTPVFCICNIISWNFEATSLKLLPDIRRNTYAAAFVLDKEALNEQNRKYNKTFLHIL